jgi:hypothetical protein
MTSWFWEADKTANPPARQGMPSALINNGSQPPLPKEESRQMEQLRKAESSVCPTDSETIALRKTPLATHPTDDAISMEKKKKPHRQSFEYIWRTGVAGGLAGCAVCNYGLDIRRSADIMGTGKDSGCPA